MISALAKGLSKAVHYGTNRICVDRVTIHHMAGNMSAKNCVDWFAGKLPGGTKVCSCNYAIGSDGEIWAGLEEEDVSYCSSNQANDRRSITIEVANDGGASSGWHVSDKAIASLVQLLADIVKRYPDLGGSLRWQGDKSLADKPGLQNITLHNWFSPTGCPGEYLEGQIPAIVRRVNKLCKPASDDNVTFNQFLYELKILMEKYGG